MRVALANDVEGIVAERGGASACATCHVFIDDRRIPPTSSIEDGMLEATAVPRERGSNARRGLAATDPTAQASLGQ